MPTVTVDPRRCEGEKKCVEVCPEGVFEMGPPDPGLPVLMRLKVFVHGGKQAYVAHPERCLGCMQCMEACPEKAVAVALDATG